MGNEMIKAGYARGRSEKANESSDEALRLEMMPIIKKQILKAADEGYFSVSINNIVNEVMALGRDQSFYEVANTIKDIASEYGYNILYVPEAVISWKHAT